MKREKVPERKISHLSFEEKSNSPRSEFAAQPSTRQPVCSPINSPRHLSHNYFCTDVRRSTSTIPPQLQQTTSTQQQTQQALHKTFTLPTSGFGAFPVQAAGGGGGGGVRSGSVCGSRSRSPIGTTMEPYWNETNGHAAHPVKYER